MGIGEASYRIVMHLTIADAIHVPSLKRLWNAPEVCAGLLSRPKITAINTVSTRVLFCSPNDLSRESPYPPSRVHDDINPFEQPAP